jgi:hypothetical protein
MPKTTQVGNAGKYDQISERLSLDLKADVVLLLVLNGRHGTGLSVSANPAKPGALEKAHGGGLAAMLRYAADALDAGEPANGARITVDLDGEQH